MGYYIDVTFNGRIKDVMGARLHRAATLAQESIDLLQEDEMEITDDGNLEWEDCNGKWHDTDTFAVWLSRWATKGAELTFVGEDGECWGSQYDGKGKMRDLKKEWKAVGKWR